VEVTEPTERSQLCESILRELPEWFGIEDATAAYIRDMPSCRRSQSATTAFSP
jgi:hypothetical protein